LDAKLQESSRLDWARQLFYEGDYDRAITVYKEIRYFASDDARRKVCEFQIARCSLGLGLHNSASVWIGQYLSHESLSAEQVARARLLMGLNYARQRLVPMAAMQFAQVSPQEGDGLLAICMAWMAAEREKWQSAKTGFEEAARSYPPEQSTTEMLGKWAHQMDRAKSLHWRSAAKAAMLSAIVPGSGQFYCGHMIDGLQAFFYVSAFGLATWAAYRYESAFHQPRIGTVIGVLFTSTFHIANIWGAQQTALYRNHRFHEELLQPIREDVIQLEFALPAP
jgi:TM2 domain-containing membrane protein YozV